MEELQVQYKGKIIRWLDHLIAFRIIEEGHMFEKDFRSIEEAKKYIDAEEKKEFERIPIIKINAEGNNVQNFSIRKGTVTSISLEGSNCYYWISWEGKRREKSYQAYHLDTEANNKIAEEIFEIARKRVEMYKEMERLFATMERVKGK